MSEVSYTFNQVYEAISRLESEHNYGYPEFWEYLAAACRNQPPTAGEAS